jgi:hypothetical protein
MTGHKCPRAYRGLQLKSDNSFKVGASKSHRKEIVKINITTNEIRKYKGLVLHHDN